MLFKIDNLWEMERGKTFFNTKLILELIKNDKKTITCKICA